MQTYIQWVRWAGILAAAVVAIRLAVRFWRFRGIWKMSPSASVRVTMSPTPLGTVTNGAAPTASMRYGPVGVSPTPSVHTTRIVAHSANEIPKEVLEALTPEQRKMVLDHLPGGSEAGASRATPAVPKKQS